MFMALVGKGCNQNPHTRQKEMNEAWRWFFGNDPDFECWCDDADLHPEFVRERARHVLEHGLPMWRAAPGNGKRYEERKAYREKNGKTSSTRVAKEDRETTQKEYKDRDKNFAFELKRAAEILQFRKQNSHLP